MPKAIISNRIYMDLPPNKEDIFKELTYKVEKSSNVVMGINNIEIIRNYKMITPTVISIPQGRKDLIPSNYEVIDKRIVEFADFPEPLYQLFPEQQIVYDEVEDTCIVSALVGWGKSFFGLHVASKFGMKTLVVVHTASLRDQWVKEVEKMYAFKPDIVGDGKFAINTPIVVGNIQSLVKNIERVEKEFGTVILDEMHHVPADTFSKFLDKMHARYRLGLSGTIERRDGKHILFKDFFGPTIYRPPQNNTIDPTIYLLKPGIKLPPGRIWADRITALLSDKEYQEFIASIALVQANKGHKVLIIADRINFLEEVAEMLGDRAVAVIGTTDNRDSELEKIKNGTKDILCGSRLIFSEGISLNELSCVVLAIPIANANTLEQIIGRVMRLADSKLDPVVIDLQFSGATEHRQNSVRLGFYMKKGWKTIRL